MFTLDGVIDLHVHAGPDVLGRVGDDIDIATGCRDAGMAGMAVKAHLESTSSRAYHTNKAVPGFRYIGGVCLNYPVGGINPAAVDACLRLGGRVVWMPSGHSRFHAEVTGALGNWGYSDMDIYNPADAAGISVLDADGELTPATREVVALVHEHDALLATSHLSPQEILALAAYCRPLGVKLIVTHIRWTPEYDLELARRACELGAVIEITCSTVGGYTNRFPIDEVVATIDELTPQQLVIASDAGGVRHPRPHEALRVLASNLWERGVSEAALTTMLKENPARLIAGG
ncbi:DUF6282 family protein [Kribbella sp. NPDC050241]|uniref:DUF6282 family protein n=1 Tax=Kribbella sp. NPDC050241 TaxID=3364115 RepID=UPI0037B1EAA0